MFDWTEDLYCIANVLPACLPWIVECKVTLDNRSKVIGAQGICPIQCMAMIHVLNQFVSFRKKFLWSHPLRSPWILVPNLNILAGLKPWERWRQNEVFSFYFIPVSEMMLYVMTDIFS